MSEPIIKIKNLTFTYPDSEEPTLKDISLDVEQGTWTAIIGHNGSGKSTLTKLLNRLLVPDDDEKTDIVINGIKLTDDTMWEVRNNLGIVFQNPDNQFVGATVEDDVAFGLENRSVPREDMLKIVDESIKLVNMEAFKKTEPARLSGGQKQRVAIAGVVAIKPQIIVLDESTSMLDPEGKADVLQVVEDLRKKNNLTVLSVTHDIEEASTADQVIVLDDGKIIAQGKPSEIFHQVDLIKSIGLDVPFYMQLIEELDSKGIEIPSSINSEKELVEYLWKLNSKM